MKTMKTCHVCGGEGCIEWSEDCWSHFSGHFTREYGATCTACDGEGEVEVEEPPGWLTGTPEGACAEPEGAEEGPDVDENALREAIAALEAWTPETREECAEGL